MCINSVKSIHLIMQFCIKILNILQSAINFINPNLNTLINSYYFNFIGYRKSYFNPFTIIISLRNIIKAIEQKDLFIFILFKLLQSIIF